MLMRAAAALMVLCGTAVRPAEAVEAADQARLNPWIGPVPSPFELELMSGGRVPLVAFNGQVVLLHFFATWCEPCRAEMAALQSLASRYVDRPLTILAIDVAEVAPRVRRFFEAQPVSFRVLLDADRAVSKAWQISALPTTVALDRTLVPRWVSDGDLGWDLPEVTHILDRLLASQPADLRPREQQSHQSTERNAP